MKKIYNKLVRDNIPLVCEKNGQNVKIKILDDKKYVSALRKKLKEEVTEYLISKNIEELADIVEVVETLAENQGSSLEEILDIKQRKQKENGAFRDKIFLISVDDK